MGKTDLSASKEDYLETIFVIVSEKQAVRAKDIAARMNVTRPSVSEALRVLAREGLVNHEPYDVITLTADGVSTAQSIVRRHQALHEFFVSVLGVAEDEADSAACAVEHVLSNEIVDRLADFVGHLQCDSRRTLSK